MDESLFVVSQTLSIRDFLTPELNKVPCLLFISKFKSVGLLNLKNHGTQFLKQAFTHFNAKFEETLFSITRFENRTQAALIFNFSGKFFFILAC